MEENSRVKLSFFEKITHRPISGMKVLIKKNNKQYAIATSDEFGNIFYPSGFKRGDNIEISVEKVVGGYKKIAHSIIDEYEFSLAIISSKVQATVETDWHSGQSQEWPQTRVDKKTGHQQSYDLLDELSALEEEAAKAGSRIAKDRSVQKMRSANGHPKAVLVLEPIPSTSSTTLVQRTIPGLLFPLSKRPDKSYKTQARRFGAGRGDNRMHAGIDLYAPVGTPVRAMTNGIVIDTAYFYSGTWVIEVEHEKFIARYGEVDKNTILVKKGQKIQRGEIIGYVRKLDNFPHSMLHLEIYATTESPSKPGRGLTQKNNPPFKRREDLIDPTGSMDYASME